MRKITRKILPIALGLAAVISVILSFLIWTNPARYERSKQNSTNNTQTEAASRSIDDIYLPTQVIATDTVGHHDLLNDRQLNLATEIRDKMNRWKGVSSSTAYSVSKARYQETLNQKDAIILNYSSLITTKIFNEVFKDQLADIKSGHFNKIILPLDSSNEVYLLNDRSLSITTVKTQGRAKAPLQKLLNATSVDKIPVSFTMLNDRPLVYYDKATPLKRYSYLINKQSADFFVNRLLNRGESSNIDLKRSKAELVYSDHGSRQLTVDRKDSTVFYEDYNSNEDTSGQSFSDFLTNGYSRLVDVGVPLDNIRYYDFDLDSHSVTYRSFVEGFPIFNQTEYGAVRIQSKKGARQDSFSLFSLQVPLPENDKDKTMPSTTTMLARLTSVGVRTSKISDIEMGYQWTTSKTSNKVVSLQPEWYIHYDGSWKTYDQLLAGNP